MNVDASTFDGPSKPPIFAAKSPETKTTTIFFRTVNSPLFKAILLTFTTITFTAIVIPLLAPHLTSLIVPLVAMGGVTSLTAFIVLNKRARFEFTLIYTLLSLKAPWNEIQYGIILGRIPLNGDQGELKKLKIGAVLSMVEDFELDSGGFFKPLQLKDWNAFGFEPKQIEARDFIAVTQEQIEEGVQFIEDQVGLLNKVYVHCKAGRGRSTTVVVCYLLKAYPEPFSTVQKAIDFVKKIRPDIHLNPKQKDAINIFFKTHRSPEI